jgi:hypothetical protein
MFNKYINENKLDIFFDNVSKMNYLKMLLPASIQYSYDITIFSESVKYKNDLIELIIHRHLHKTTKTIYIKDILVYENGEWKYPVPTKMFKYIRAELKEIFKFNKQCERQKICKTYKLYLKYYYKEEV